jgi:hypothetical protein
MTRKERIRLIRELEKIDPEMAPFADAMLDLTVGELQVLNEAMGRALVLWQYQPGRTLNEAGIDIRALCREVEAERRRRNMKIVG